MLRLSLIALLAAPLPALAQQPANGRLVITSPQQAVELALARAPVLRGAAAGVRAAQGDRLQAGLRPNPEVSISGDGFGGTRSYAGIRSLETTATLSQRLEVGGQRQSRIRAAQDALALAGLDAQAVRLELIREVTRTLAEAVAALREIDIAQERLRLANEVIRATQARVEAGRDALAQQRRAEVARETARVALGRAQQNADIAARNLAALLAAPAVQVNAARAGWFDDLGPRPAAPAAMAADQLDRARLDALTTQRRSELEVQRRLAIPDVSVSGGVRHYREGGGDASFVLGLSIPLPVFDRNQGNIMRAGAEVARAEAEAERGRLYLDASMSESERRLEQAWRAADALRRTALPAAQEAARHAREGYAEGKFSLLEVLDAQRALSDVREELNTAQLAVQQVRADIARLRGRAQEPTGTTSR
ncbi:TolC family protein [Rhodovarius crocodyli]|uniref:TolC family protein n=1 Tax=Rhodovarius crocodyli TaxID=1979269 RepID=A0A437MDN4_9PROT|nr:TolC family protein [Rhodovarius crocodyli]RVT95751.1 TolC family protein [Rhodovarius crocodyli]